MEIIKQGDKERAYRKHLDIRKFVCPDCCCVWTASNKEYTYGNQHEPGAWMTCPCCGKTFVDACDGNYYGKMVDIL